MTLDQDVTRRQFLKTAGAAGLGLAATAAAPGLSRPRTRRPCPPGPSAAAG